MSDRPKWSYEQAKIIAEVLVEQLAPACTRIQIAGSLRRHKAEVGDIEIVYVPRLDEAKLPGEMFPQPEQDLADLAIQRLEMLGVLKRRLNMLGRQSFGRKNKLMCDAATGIPVDLFAATEDNWFNYLVCRTGPADSNVRICNAAIERGWKWNPYGDGFSRPADPPFIGTVTASMPSEKAVFEFVGLQCRPPEERE